MFFFCQWQGKIYLQSVPLQSPHLASSVPLNSRPSWHAGISISDCFFYFFALKSSVEMRGFEDLAVQQWLHSHAPQSVSLTSGLTSKPYATIWDVPRWVRGGRGEAEQTRSWLVVYNSAQKKWTRQRLISITRRAVEGCQEVGHEEILLHSCKMWLPSSTGPSLLFTGSNAEQMY